MPETAPLRRWTGLGALGQAAVAGLGWYGAAKFGALVAPAAGHALLPFFPASGVLLALLLLTPQRRWPTVCAGAAAAIVAYNLGGKGLAVTAALLAADLVLPLLGAAIVRKVCGGPPDLRRLSDMTALVLAGGVLAPMVGGAISAGAISAVDGVEFGRTWVVSVLSNAGGVLLVTPLIVSWVRGPRWPRPRALAEIAAATLATAVAAGALFFGAELPLVWIALIIPASAALLGGVRAASVCVLPWVLMAVIATRDGSGIYAASTNDLTDAILYAQASTATGLVVCDMLGAVSAQLRDAVRRLRRSEENVRLLVEGVRDHAMFMVEREGRIASWNAGAERMLGRKASEVLTEPLSALLCDGEKIDLTGGGEQERWVRRADGTTFLGRFAGYSVHPSEHDTGDCAVVLRDVTEARRAEQELRHMALHDSLTGLPNRTLLHDRLSVALSQSRREHRRVAVLFCDLDRFKVINDSLGHDQGDEVLRHVAARLRGVVRPGDTVARFGGDEFVLCCQDVEGSHDAVRIAERVHAELRRPLLIGEEVFVGVSIGIAVARPDSTADELIRDADAAMYRVKERGGGHALVDAADHKRALGRLRGEAEIRRALERDELELNYQPIMDLESGRAVAVEALLRWNHPGRGKLAPAEFIRLAEDTGAIVDIGTWAIEEACRAGHRLREKAKLPDLRVNVNVSARQLVEGFVEAVGAALGRTASNPRTLCLELTETTLIEDLPVNEQTLNGLKRLGVQIAMDDFGTGYSSLAYLRRLPIDQLKLDRSFVTEIDDEGAGAPVLQAAIAMSEALKVDLVAEGVERLAQVGVLGSLGFRFAQGFYFARPLPELEMAEWLTDVRPPEGNARRLRVVGGGAE